MYALGIDLGTTFTAAAVWRDGRAEISSLGSRSAAIPSVVVLREDETIITGETASRRAMTSPHRVAREFKRRLGDTTPILLAGVPYSAESLMARMLRAVVDEVSTREGGAPSSVCVSHPANWGPYKTDLLRQAVRSANLDGAIFTTEPEAAAVFYAQQQRIPDGAVVAVYDLGGGTFDAAVLRKTSTGFEILGRPEGIERLGGIDIDAAVFAHVARALNGALQELDEDDPATISAVGRLKEECTEAKEALSSDTDTTIPVLLPNLVTEVRLTRGELESMVRPALQDTLDALRRALRSAGVTAEELHSVLLVGGSSRMPIVAQLVGAELGRPVAVDVHPKHAVALGAAYLAGGPTSAVAPAPTPLPMVTSEPPTQIVPPPPAGPVSPAGQVAPGGQVSPGGQVLPGGPASGGRVPPSGQPVAASAPRPVTDDPFPVSARTPVGRTPAAGPSSSTSSSSAGRPPAGPPMMIDDGDFWQPAPTGSQRAVGGTPPRAGSGRSGSGRGRMLAATLAVLVVIGLGAAGAYALNHDNGSVGAATTPTTTKAKAKTTTKAAAVVATTPATNAATSSSSNGGETVPEDEQCSAAIKANTRWVCLTSATFDEGALTINYKSNFAGVAPNAHGGYHLNIYGGNGVTPADNIEGRQSMTPGHWYVEDQNPSIVKATSDEYKTAIGSAPKVCARIADSNDMLVPDKNGTFVTGNCVTIRKI